MDVLLKRKDIEKETFFVNLICILPRYLYDNKIKQETDGIILLKWRTEGLKWEIIILHQRKDQQK